MPHVSTVWLCAARLHWATVSEVWQRATARHGPVQPSHVDTMLVSTDRPQHPWHGFLCWVISRNSDDVDPNHIHCAWLPCSRAEQRIFCFLTPSDDDDPCVQQHFEPYGASPQQNPPSLPAQAALQLSDAQRDAQVANTASMLQKFITACRVHREVLQDLTRLPLTASGIHHQHDMVRRCIGWLA